MTESNATINAIMSWTYTSPRFFFSVGLPCGFVLFAPREWVDPILRSSNIPEILNPWLGLVFLLMSSFFALGFLFHLPWYLTMPFRKWKQYKESKTRNPNLM